jgi:hypothetical protein
MKQIEANGTGRTALLAISLLAGRGLALGTIDINIGD